MVRYAYDRGVRYYDTADNYGESQKLIGEALKDVRKDVFLTSKGEVMRAERTRQVYNGALSVRYLLKTRSDFKGQS